MTTATRLLFDRLETPIGETVIATDETGALRMLDWQDHAARWRAGLARFAPEAEWTTARDPFGATSALAAYMDGNMTPLANFAVVYAGTEFQNRVWRALRDIPCGETVSYGELARRVGNPKGSRAVGLANGANPIAIAVPCHRVVGAGGALTGYGGGLPRKRWLLAHEARHAFVMSAPAS
jgi:methylated-DNA-[protein]-cysteine S-methyltransferase